MIKRNDYMTFATNSNMFRAATARFSHIDGAGHAIFRDDRGNYGEFRANNCHRLTFKNEEAVEEYIRTH